ncbi:MAG TPA: RNA polymerase sigma factor, partial [Solirubrobacterales bacterium]
MTEAAASGPSRGRVANVPLRAPARLLPDERLSRRATTGDRGAIEEIFRRYHQDLYRFCLATVSNQQDAQEALQNTMVKVMRALPGEQREIKLKPWLFRVARNEAIETMRKRRDTVELGSTQIAAPWEIADAASARARLRDLFSDLGELPERQRSALVMRELSGLDFDEIGEAFGTSAAVARQTLYEARQSLRQMDEGREMSCESIRKAISDADGRVTRRRDIRAHLRDCAGCGAFRDDISQRREGFAAISPLPAAAALGLLQGVLGGEAAGGAALASGAGAAAGGGTAAGGGVAAGGGAAGGGAA